MKQLYSLFIQNPSICTDTRNIFPNSIFFALKGGNFNANEFAEQAINAGCSIAVIDEAKYKKDNRYIVVSDVLKTLQNLANYHRQQLKIPIIAITGTNGKTTSKELVYAVLSQKFNVQATKGNLNNHIGVPLTLLSITNKHEIAIVEMGANHQGEIAELCSIAQPDYGMITNIGKAHLEGFGSYEGVIKAKSEMYTHIKKTGGKLFVNADNPLLNELSSGISQITFGISEIVDFKGKFIESNPFVKLKCKSKSDHTPINQKPIIQTQLVGSYNFENILAAACIGYYFKLSEEQIKNGIENYIPSNNRSQVIQTEHNLLLLDAYNANPSSMNAAIENFAQMDKPNKMVILGDMLELGADSKKEHEVIVALLKQKKITNILLVGTLFKESAKLLDTAFTFENSDELADYLKHNQKQNFTVLIKGSRGMRLEKITPLL